MIAARTSVTVKTITAIAVPAIAKTGWINVLGISIGFIGAVGLIMAGKNLPLHQFLQNLILLKLKSQQVRNIIPLLNLKQNVIN